MVYEHLIAQKAIDMTVAGAPPGVPAGPVVAAAGGEHQRYTFALICSHPTAGTHAVIGTILDRYILAGGPGGRIGYPTTDELAAGVVRYSRFVAHRAALVWHPTYIVHHVYGAIGDAYWASGGPAGPWGAPLSDEYPDGDGRSSDFENGTIHWDAVGGILEVFAPPAPPAAGDWAGTHRAARLAYAIVQLAERYRYPLNAAAGIVGNMIQESWVQPTCVEGSTQGQPLRAPDHTGHTRTFTPLEVMNRVAGHSGPRFAGSGLAQWTSPPERRSRLFTHAYRGAAYGADNLRSMDLQLDYFAWEIRTTPLYAHAEATLRRPDVTLESASDIVLLEYERPSNAVAHIPARRELGREALAAYTAFATSPL